MVCFFSSRLYPLRYPQGGGVAESLVYLLKAESYMMVTNKNSSWLEVLRSGEKNREV